MAAPALLRAADDDDSVAPLRTVHASACYQYRIVSVPVGGRIKRAFDLAATITGGLVLLPLLMLVAVLIRLDSPGPALFRQQRTGFRGRSFTIFKFRTMRTMEDGSNVQQARPGDTRLTRIGGLLRRTSIDELPQLINVLLGDMSLVGPRPHAVMHDRDFFLIDGEYPRRFLARPGITGAAQIAGARGVTDTPESVEERLRFDLEYVDNWSLTRDIAILFATAHLLLGDRNAC